jgi:hypothetical protein
MPVLQLSSVLGFTTSWTVLPARLRDRYTQNAGGVALCERIVPVALAAGLNPSPGARRCLLVDANRCALARSAGEFGNWNSIFRQFRRWADSGAKVWRRNFGILRLTSPALVCSVRS